MPPTLSKPSSAASASLFYITLGALMTVWSGIWYIYLRNNPPEHPSSHYFCYGFLGTGLVLLGIGLALGPLARLARHAELPPAEATPEVSKVQPNANANAAAAAAPAPDRV